MSFGKRRSTWTPGEDLPLEDCPRPGRLYAFVHPCTTRGGAVHQTGDGLLVLAATKECPHGEIGPFGCNWECLTSDGVTVWSTLERCIRTNVVSPVRDLTQEEMTVLEVMLR